MKKGLEFPKIDLKELKEDNKKILDERIFWHSFHIEARKISSSQKRNFIDKKFPKMMEKWKEVQQKSASKKRHEFAIMYAKRVKNPKKFWSKQQNKLFE